MIYTIRERSDLLNIRTIQGSAVDETFQLADADWSGTYVGQVVTAGTTPAEVATLTVTATFDGATTQFTIYASKTEMSTVTPGNYRWAVRRSSDGAVPVRGSWTVIAEAVPV